MFCTSQRRIECRLGYWNRNKQKTDALLDDWPSLLDEISVVFGAEAALMRRRRRDYAGYHSVSQRLLLLIFFPFFVDVKQPQQGLQHERL